MTQGEIPTLSTHIDVTLECKGLTTIAYVVDETTELADIVLPDHTEFEHHDLSPGR